MQNALIFLAILCLMSATRSDAENTQEYSCNDWQVEASNEWNYDPNEQRLSVRGPPLFVSLGHDCLPAVCMRLENLRQAAFPFDWNYTMFVENLAQILDEDFEFFLSQDLLEWGAAWHEDTHAFSRMNTRYRIEFVHDGVFNDSTVEKYKKRIARFRSLKNYAGKIIFVRSVSDFKRFPFNTRYRQVYGDPTRLGRMTREEAQQLRDALKRYFPKQDFLLLILNLEWADTPPISGVENVIECRVESFHKIKRIRRILKDLDDRFRQLNI